MVKKYGELVASIQEKMDADVDFQNSLVDLTDEDKTTAINEKQQELLDSEISALDDKATKAEEIAKNQKIRAEKAEAEAKKPKKEVKVDTSIKDRILESKALSALHEDDAEEVAEYAERKNIPLHEAIKSPYIKAYLQTRTEERASAQATAASPSRRGANKETDETILTDFSSGKVSEKTEDVEKLVKAQLAQRAKRN